MNEVDPPGRAGTDMKEAHASWPQKKELHQRSRAPGEWWTADGIATIHRLGTPQKIKLPPLMHSRARKRVAGSPA